MLFAKQGIAETEFISSKPMLRHPAAMIRVGKSLITANHRSGTISTVDLASLKVTHEAAVGGQLSDLVLMQGGRYLALSDEARHNIVLFDFLLDKVVHRTNVGAGPVQMLLIGDDRLAISCRWERQLDIVMLDRSKSNPSLRVDQSIQLPFAPHKSIVHRDSEGHQFLFVAGSFGGQLAVLSWQESRPLKLERVQKISGHNIRGMALRDDGMLLLTHQFLSSSSPTMHENVFWGSVIRNELRSMPLGQMTGSPIPDGVRGENYPISQPKDGNGDPGEFVVTKHGATVVALGGVSKVSIRPQASKPFETREVGTRPTALVLSEDQRTVYVANSLSDTISVVDIAARNVTNTIRLGPQPKLSDANHGERLFYDARLSLDGWYSCHSCHTDGHSNGLLNDNFGDGSFGAPKRILSLLGTGSTGPWAWNGEAHDLDGQIQKSVELTMQSEEFTDEQIQQLTAYVETLAAPPQRRRLNAKMIDRGRAIFKSRGCANCHSPPLYTTPESYDVNISDTKGNKLFNPPSLRGVGHRGSLFHDNRAKSLTDVFKKHCHGLNNQELADEQIKALVEFLSSL